MCSSGRNNGTGSGTLDSALHWGRGTTKKTQARASPVNNDRCDASGGQAPFLVFRIWCGNNSLNAAIISATGVLKFSLKSYPAKHIILLSFPATANCHQQNLDFAVYDHRVKLIMTSEQLLFVIGFRKWFFDSANGDGVQCAFSLNVSEKELS
jgi:hypothetical protein